MTWTVVVPTNRPDRFVEFLDAWDDLFSRHVDRLVVVQDLPAHDRQIERAALAASGYEVELHNWRTISASMIPHRTDMIRSWGIHRAWKHGTRYTLTLDDDTRQHHDVFAAYQDTFDKGAPCSSYLDVGALTTFSGQLRGFPFQDRNRVDVAVQYGGWNGILDYDAPTQLAGVNQQEWFHGIVMPVPRGAPVTGCIMNAAWRTDWAPIMWQLPMAAGRFNRFGDIWAGLFAKKTIDHLGAAMVVNGAATVRHERASDPVQNLAREAPGIPVNEQLWDALEADGDTIIGTYRAVTDSAFRYFKRHDHEYAQHFRRARDEWLGIFR